MRPKKRAREDVPRAVSICAAIVKFSNKPSALPSIPDWKNNANKTYIWTYLLNVLRAQLRVNLKPLAESQDYRIKGF